jgi:hypothetical protein
MGRYISVDRNVHHRHHPQWLRKLWLKHFAFCRREAAQRTCRKTYALCLCSLVTKDLYVRHTHTVTFHIYGNPGPRSPSCQQVLCNAKPKYFTSIAYALCLCSLVTQVLYATKSDRVLHGAVPFCGRECRIYHI